MSQRKVKAGEAYVELTARDKMAAGLAAAQKRLKAFAVGAQQIGQAVATVGAGVLGAGTALAGGLAAAAKVFADTGDEINKMADRTGVAHEELSRWVHAANQSGASAKLLEMALRNMAKNGMDPRRFADFAAEIAAIEDPALKVARALEIWGKGGAMMLPVARDLAALSAEADALGLIITPEAANRATALGDAWGNLLRVGKDLAYEIGDAIAVPLTALVNTMTQAGVAAAGFIQHNKGLVVTMGAVAGVLVAVGAGLVATGGAITLAGAAVAAITAGAAALVTPVGAIAAAVTLVAGSLFLATAGWVLFTQSGQAAVAAMAPMLQGITNAIAKGDVLNAWGQLANGMAIVWAEMAQRVTAAFFDMAKSVVQAMHKAMAAVTGTLVAAEVMTGRDMGSETAAAGMRALTGAGAALDMLKAQALASQQNEITGLQNQLDALRNLVASPAQTAAGRAAAFAGLDLGNALGGGAGMGGAAGTFNAASAGLLGRAAPKLEREAEKQTDLQGQMVDLLEAIEGGIDSLEGFAMA